MVFYCLPVSQKNNYVSLVYVLFIIHAHKINGTKISINGGIKVTFYGFLLLIHIIAAVVGLGASFAIPTV